MSKKILSCSIIFLSLILTSCQQNTPPKLQFCGHIQSADISGGYFGSIPDDAVMIFAGYGNVDSLVEAIVKSNFTWTVLTVGTATTFTWKEDGDSFTMKPSPDWVAFLWTQKCEGYSIVHPRRDWEFR